MIPKALARSSQMALWLRELGLVRAHMECSHVWDLSEVSEVFEEATAARPSGRGAIQAQLPCAHVRSQAQPSASAFCLSLREPLFPGGHNMVSFQLNTVHTNISGRSRCTGFFPEVGKHWGSGETQQELAALAGGAGHCQSFCNCPKPIKSSLGSLSEQ